MLEFVVASVVVGLVAVAALCAVFLRKPELAVVGADPERTLQDLAARLRVAGFEAIETPRFVRIRIDSLSALKVRARTSPIGTVVRYEVSATPLGWALVLVAGVLGEGVGSLILAGYIHVTAGAFARQRVLSLLGSTSLPPPQGPSPIPVGP